VLTALAIAVEVAGVHQPDVGSVVEADHDHFAAVEKTEIVVEEIHGYLYFTVVLGWERPCLAVT
jgi:hypothetical protein